MKLWQKSTQPLLQSGYGLHMVHANRSKMHEPSGLCVAQVPGCQPPQFGQPAWPGGNGPQPGPPGPLPLPQLHPAGCAIGPTSIWPEGPMAGYGPGSTYVGLIVDGGAPSVRTDDAPGGVGGTAGGVG